MRDGPDVRGRLAREGGRREGWRKVKKRETKKDDTYGKRGRRRGRKRLKRGNDRQVGVESLKECLDRKRTEDGRYGG